MNQEPGLIFDKTVGPGPIEALRTFHELKSIRTLLNEENEKYREQIKALTGELEVVNIAIDESEEFLAQNKNKIEILLEEIESHRVVRNRLTEDVNQLRLELKAAISDRDSSSLALETMSQELDNIKDEKEILINRLKSVGEGIKKICQAREYSVPELKDHDQIFRKVYRVFKEAGDRMDVSIQLRGIGSGEND
jgi:chromosome segregation ATPase